jgi:diaminopimelate epimerase
MATLIPFSKYEGLGNDFVLIDDPYGRMEMSPEIAAAICDRHLGIGADGVLKLVAAGSSGAAGRMRYWNADGTPAAMCGNGVRCVAKHLRDRHAAPLGPFLVETDAGPVACRITFETDAFARVEVEMPAPRLDPAAVPVRLDAGATELVRRSGDREVRLLAVSMGNPHAVTFDVEDAEERLRLGPALSSDPAFPEKANVGFARMPAGDVIELDVYERGSGWTPACGSGASAAAVAACATGRTAWGTPLAVCQRGGELRITAAGPDLPVRMEGPARRVFEGTFVLRHLLPTPRPSTEY